MDTTAHILPYSTLKKSHTRGRIEQRIGDVAHCSRDEVKCITREHYNRLVGADYVTIQALIFDPPSFEKELSVRRHIIASPYDLSTILVVETLPRGKIELELVTHTWEDVRERLIPSE
jgi:hypothetical protein